MKKEILKLIIDHLNNINSSDDERRWRIVNTISQALANEDIELAVSRYYVYHFVLDL